MNRLLFSPLLLAIFAIGVLLAAACTPEATPFPVDIPTPDQATLPAGSTSTTRYAFAANTEGFVTELSLIQDTAEVEQLTDPIDPTDLGQRYDIVATYGDLPDGTRSPVTPHIAFILNPAASPLDNPFLFNIVSSSLNPSAIVELLDINGAVADIRDFSSPSILRTELANAGWPDGLSLSMAHSDTPGVLEIADCLEKAGIRARLLPISEDEIPGAFDEGLIQIALVAWETPEERAEWVNRYGEVNVIELYSVPISYLAVPDIQLTFTPSGWPIPDSG